MKIIIRDEQGIKRCFVQVRDVDYLVERFNTPKLKRLAMGMELSHDHKDIDFIEIKNEAIAKVFEENPYIVDFSEVVKFDNLTISRMMVLSSVPISTGKQKMDEDHKVEDLLDIMNFNKGMLTYPIPVLYDEKMLFEDGKVVFGSTTIPGYYMLRSNDKETDLVDYFMDNVDLFFHQINPEGEMKDYSITKVNDSILVHFEVKKKILSKLIKRITA